MPDIYRFHWKKSYGRILFGVAASYGLWLSSTYNYLLFHSIAEVFSIVVAFAIFLLAWSSRKITTNYFLLFLGVAYFFVGSLDLIHTLAYKGMGIFSGHDANLPTQLWIAARYLECLSLIAASILMNRKQNMNAVFLGYAAISILLLLSIFHWQVFPDCYIEDSGLTPFKIYSEYIISLLLLVSIAVLWKKRGEFDSEIFQLIILSILFTIVSELALTFYISIYGLSNFVGHLSKIISFYFIYRAIIAAGLKKPLEVLFKDLQTSRESLREANDNLELQVKKRTIELAKTNEELLKEIEEHRKAEKKLLDAKISYRMIADFTYHWEWWKDVDGTFRYISPACERITGYKADQFIENDSLLGEIVVPEDRDAWNRHHHESRKDSGLREMQFRIRRADGEIRWIEHACQPVFTREGDFLGFRASNQDITRRKLAEEKVRESGERYLDLYENAPIAYLSVGTDSIIIRCNSSATRILGYPGKELVGKSIFDLYADTYHGKEKAEKVFQRFLGQKQIVEEELQMVRGDGKHIWVKLTVNVVLDPKGGIIESRSMLVDITEQKLAERAKEESEAELRVLSAQLMSAEERERKRIARDIHDSIGQSLSAIKFSVENALLVISEKTIPSAVESLEKIIPITQQSIEEVRRIIMDLRPSTLDDLGLVSTISWFCREFESVFTNIKIERRISVEESDIPAYLKIVIYRILQEAMNNAAKHSRTDTVLLYLVRHYDSLELMIEDTGIGFEMGESKSGGAGRKGMGLISMKERAQRSGGTFSNWSRPGTGTRIQVFWPLKVLSGSDQGQ